MLLQSDGRTWCAYSDNAEFESDATTERPIESARVTYLANKLVEVTHQIEAESGDWIVVDKYTVRKSDIVIRRANLMAQENLQIIEEASIQAKQTKPFQVLNVTTLDGKKAQLPPNIDLPSVPVETSLSTLPFVRVVAEMRSRSTGKLCLSPLAAAAFGDSPLFVGRSP